MFNASRPVGLDKWTMDVCQYELMHNHILETIDAFADDGTVPLKTVVTAAQALRQPRAVPQGRVRNYCSVTKVDLEARCEIERAPGASPQRIRRWSDD